MALPVPPSKTTSMMYRPSSSSISAASSKGSGDFSSEASDESEDAELEEEAALLELAELAELADEALEDDFEALLPDALAEEAAELAADELLAA